MGVNTMLDQQRKQLKAWRDHQEQMLTFEQTRAVQMATQQANQAFAQTSQQIEMQHMTQVNQVKQAQQQQNAQIMQQAAQAAMRANQFKMQQQLRESMHSAMFQYPGKP